MTDNTKLPPPAPGTARPLVWEQMTPEQEETALRAQRRSRRRSDDEDDSDLPFAEGRDYDPILRFIAETPPFHRSRR